MTARTTPIIFVASTLAALLSVPRPTFAASIIGCALGNGTAAAALKYCDDVLFVKVESTHKDTAGNVRFSVTTWPISNRLDIDRTPGTKGEILAAVGFAAYMAENESASCVKHQSGDSSLHLIDDIRIKSFDHRYPDQYSCSLSYINSILLAKKALNSPGDPRGTLRAKTILQAIMRAPSAAERNAIVDSALWNWESAGPIDRQLLIHLLGNDSNRPLLDSESYRSIEQMFSCVPSQKAWCSQRGWETSDVNGLTEALLFQTTSRDRNIQCEALNRLHNFHPKVQTGLQLTECANASKQTIDAAIEAWRRTADK